MAQCKEEHGMEDNYLIGDERVPKAVIDSMRVVSDWMYKCMFMEQTRWSSGNEYDSMGDCRNYMAIFLSCADLLEEEAECELFSRI